MPRGGRDAQYLCIPIKLKFVGAHDFQACSKAPNSGKSMQATSVILSLTCMVVFVAVQETAHGKFFSNSRVPQICFYLLLEKILGVVGKKNVKNVTPHISETRLDIRRLQMIVFLILLFQGQYHDMVIMEQFRKSRVDTKKKKSHIHKKMVSKPG